ncbi:hypothetical protein [Ruegeria arenilitoris]|uniref:hypothetical protein n=1 Tax=Ruegeria arenilitoris TaxID=1173585 RepID=UPI00147ED67E|nr:hypothetical protein [Ruegeria arenilitoris]
MKNRIEELEEMLSAAQRTIETMRVEHDKDLERAKEHVSRRDALEIDRLTAEVNRLKSIEHQYLEIREWVCDGPLDRLTELENEIAFLREAVGTPHRRSTGRPPAIPDRLCIWVWDRHRNGQSVYSLAKELNVSRGAVRSALDRSIHACAPSPDKLSKLNREITKLKKGLN